MLDYTAITQVKTTDSEEDANNLLSGEWVLLEVCKQEGKPVFVLGLPYSFDMDTLCSEAVSEAN